MQILILHNSPNLNAFFTFSIYYFTHHFQVLMSIDRYLAIVHPLSSIRYRTIQNAWGVCVVTWMACVVIMTPYWMYARTSPLRDGTVSCRMLWPRSDNLAYEWFWTNFQVSAHSFALYGSFNHVIVS